MATIDTSSPYVSFHLTDEEISIGVRLNDLNHKVLQNRIATLAEQLLLLDVDPLNVIEFVKTRALLQGEINGLRYLLMQSIDSQASQQISI
jgi:hypothetical protein